MYCVIEVYNILLHNLSKKIGVIMPKAKEKGLHPRNPHNARYDFEALIKSEPKLESFVSENLYGDLSIDFSNADAVLMLNRAILLHFYGLSEWKIPKGYLCPPIPGRVDYIHYLADLLSVSNGGKLPQGKKVRGLDVGVGANCIYPIVGSAVYGWDFVGSDVDAVSIASAKALVEKNSALTAKVEIRAQHDADKIFSGVITKSDRFTFSICNPPFHTSAEAAQSGTQRKNRNLSKNSKQKRGLNFGGQSNELWCPGGEVAFIRKMIMESLIYKKRVLWFTTLVSKKENLPAIYKALKAVKPYEVKTVEMKQGQKITRFVAWTYHNAQMQKAWF